MSQINIFLSTQSSPEPSHRCTATLARQIASMFPHLVVLDEKERKMTIREAWSAIKARLRPKSTTGVTKYREPVIQDSGMSIMLVYPPTDQSSYAERHRREIWGNATRF